MQSGGSINPIQQTLDLIDDENFSKCFAAIEKDDAPRLRALIEHGADIMQATRNGTSAVMVAAMRECWRCVEVILDYLSPPFLEWHSDKARKLASKLSGVLLLAVKANQVELLKKWLGKYNKQHYSGGFFLKEIRFYLGHKVCQDAQDGSTALHHAVQQNNADFIVRVLSLDSLLGKKELVKTKNNDEETFLDLAFKLKNTAWLGEVNKYLVEWKLNLASMHRVKWRLEETIKASSIGTLYEFLMLNLFDHTNSRQDKLLDYILALPDSDKPVALSTALNQTTKLGSYMAAGVSFERHRRIMQAELQRLVAPQAELPQSAAPEPSVDSKKAEELRPIFRQIPSVKLLFPSVPKQSDTEKKERKKKSEEKEVEQKEARPRKMVAE